MMNKKGDKWVGDPSGTKCETVLWKDLEILKVKIEPQNNPLKDRIMEGWEVSAKLKGKIEDKFKNNINIIVTVNTKSMFLE